MQQSNEQATAKIDGVIADIRMINLHLFNFMCGLKRDEGREGDKEKKMQDFHKLNIAHFQEHSKRVEEYLKKSFREMTRTKLVLSPVSFRFFKPRYKEEDFLRFENENYGVKFVLTDLEKEALLHIEIYKISRGGRWSSLALRKLEVKISFLNDLSQRFGQGVVWLEIIEKQGKTILEEVITLMSGETCNICNKHLSFNPDLQVYLPPTVRQGRKPTPAYYHESCL